MPLSWEKLDDYCLHSADGRYWLAATYDATHVVYFASVLEKTMTNGKTRHGYRILKTARAPIDDREARDAAISELRTLCAEDDARGR